MYDCEKRKNLLSFIGRKLIWRSNNWENWDVIPESFQNEAMRGDEMNISLYIYIYFIIKDKKTNATMVSQITRLWQVFIKQEKARHQDGGVFDVEIEVDIERKTDRKTRGIIRRLITLLKISYPKT